MAGLMPPGEFQAWVKQKHDQLARAATFAVDAAGNGLKQDLRGMVRAAGLGEKLPLGIRHKTFPGGGRVSLRAASEVTATPAAARILKGFIDGSVIRGKHGQYLAIPLPAVPRKGGRGGGKKMSPVEVESFFNIELRFAPRRGKPPLLVLDKARGARSRRFKRSFGAADAAARARASVPMFVLLRQVKLPRLLSPEQAVAAWKSRVEQLFWRALPNSGG